MSLEDKKKLLGQLAFIHQRLTQTSQYFISEFEVARDSIATIEAQCKEIAKQIEDEVALERVKAKESV
jgi:hypothetical protein